MNFRRSLSFPAASAFASLAIFSALVLAGCKSGTPPANGAQSGNASNGQAASGVQQGPGMNGASPAAYPSQAGPSAPQAPPPPAVADLPAGTRLRIRLDQDLGSKISQPGDTFSATVADDVVVNGQTVIRQGARAEGTVIDAKPLGRIKGSALLEVRLERVQSRWGSYPVATSTIERVEKGKGKRTGFFAAGGAGLGALIGGLAGGGKGALIGGLAGAGAGTAGSAFTGNKNILLPAETLLTFRLEHSVHITEQRQ